MPPPPQRKKANPADRFQDPTFRYAAIGLGAILVVAVAFGLGRLTSGSAETETEAVTTAATTDNREETSATDATTTAAPTTTTTTTTTTTLPIGFDDVGESTPYAEQINALTYMGIRVGCNPPANTLYCPGDPMTRGQMASLLVGALGFTDEGDSDLFADDDGTAFEADIQKIAIAGITKGCNPPDNNLFCPDDLVTRGQIAVFLVRAFGLDQSNSANLFSDDDGSVYEPAIQTLATAGILEGCNPPDNSEVCPAENVTRGEMAALLVKALDQR
jgi:hypothetical protein